MWGVGDALDRLFKLLWSRYADNKQEHFLSNFGVGVVTLPSPVVQLLSCNAEAKTVISQFLCELEFTEMKPEKAPGQICGGEGPGPSW